MILIFLILFIVASVVTILLGRRYRTCRNTQAREARQVVYGYPVLSILLMAVVALDADGFGTWVGGSLFVVLTTVSIWLGRLTMNGLLSTRSRI